MLAQAGRVADAGRTPMFVAKAAMGGGGVNDAPALATAAIAIAISVINAIIT